MVKGIEQLEQWLHDIIRIGLLQYDFGEKSIFEISSRMVDAKLGGIARRIRRISTLNRADPQWAEWVLSILSELSLLVSAFQKRHDLNLSSQISIYTIAGFNITKTELLKLSPIEDSWLICGLHYEEEENLRARFMWVMGQKSKRTALILDFAFGRTEFEFKYDFKKSYQGSLRYYPGSFPVRAHLQNPVALQKIRMYPGAFESIDKFLDIYATAVAKNPWINEFPACIKEVSLLRSREGQFVLEDNQGKMMKLANNPETVWPIFASLALSPFTIFGLWNGKMIKLLSFADRDIHLAI